MPRFEHQEGSFDYAVIRTNRRTMAIQIDPAKGVVVRAPNKARDSEIQKMLEKKIPWITKHLAAARQKAAEVPRHDFKAGDVFLFLGEKHMLSFKTGRQNKVETAGFFIIVTLKPDTGQDAVPGLLEKWYRARARETFDWKVQDYAKRLEVKPGRITIRGQTRRWGSCSSKGNLNFNWKLIMAQPEILDYVVAHELCHLKYMDHQKEFWMTLGRIMPDYEQRRKWLKQNGHTLGF